MSSSTQCTPLNPDTSIPVVREPLVGNGSNTIIETDHAFHDWYRIVLSFPPHLVRHYFEEFGLGEGAVVLDPFCGTGTTMVEARLGGIDSVGIEAHPFLHFASDVKVDWEADPEALTSDAERVCETVLSTLKSQGLDDSGEINGELDGIQLVDLEPGRRKLLIKRSISPLPLHKSLLLLNELNKLENERHYNHLRLAFARTLVSSIGNLRFGPEVGVGKVKTDAVVTSSWLDQVKRIADDLRNQPNQNHPSVTAKLADSRQLDNVLPHQSVDAVITSPPYPNEKDYTRTTRLESVLLGFISSRQELRSIKQAFIRSNTRGVYKADTDHEWISDFNAVQDLAVIIETKRKKLGKTSGFEKLYHRVTRLYFGGMARHLDSLKTILKPGANLAYVVGDQASYLRVMIRTGHLVAELAERFGYEVQRIDLFRKRFATATRQELNEEVIVLRWPGEACNGKNIK